MTPSGGRDETTVEVSLGTGIAEAMSGSASFVPGGSLGRYLVIEELGRGGMGVVLRAYDPKLQREVAVKVLHKDTLRDGLGEGSVGWERLVREARAMARLSHPNVVGVHDVDLEHGDGAMIVMQYVPGTDLRSWLKARTRSTKEIIEAFVAAGRGLAAAHEQELLHRDFKPSNVLVGDDGTVKVTDFGLARAATGNDSADESDAIPVSSNRNSHGGESDSLSRELTEVGTVMGTPRFMPPEQLRGGDLDARADQYALCVALWHALTDQWPFATDKLKVGGPPVWPRGAAAPRHVVEALRRGLEPNRDKRWPSVTALLEELQRKPGKRRLQVGVAGVLALAGLGLWGSSSAQQAQRVAACTERGDAIAQVWNPSRTGELKQAFETSAISYAADTWPRLEPRLDVYAKQWASAATEVCTATEIDQSLDAPTAEAANACLDEHRARLTALLDGWSPLDATGVREALRAVAALPPMSMCTDPSHLRQRANAPDSADARETVETLRRELATARSTRASGHYEDALGMAEHALHGATALGWRPLTAEAGIEVGAALTKLGRYGEAEDRYEQAFVDAGASGQDLLAAKAAVSLEGLVGARLERHEDGLRWGKLATMTIDRLDLTEHTLVADELNNAGMIHQAREAYGEALVSHQAALAIREQLLGPDSLAVATSLTNIGLAHLAESAYETALKFFEQSLAIQERVLGPGHPDVAAQWQNIGSVHGSHGFYDKALEAFGRALEIRISSLGDNHPSVAGTLSIIGHTHMRLGDNAKAAEYHRQAQAIFEKTLGPDHPDLARSLRAQAIILANQGRYDEAVPMYERALRIFEKASAPPREIANTRFSLGQAVWESGGNRKRAHELATRAAQEYRALGADEQITAMVAESWLEGHPAPD